MRLEFTNKARTISILLFVMNILSNEILADSFSVESVYASLRNKYSSMKTISLVFQSIEPVSGIMGTLKAKKTGQYVLSLSDRKIVCDNYTVWNYIPERKMVSISSVKNKPATSIDIILFTFLYSYEPVSLKEYANGSEHLFALELQPKGKQSTMGIKKLTLYMKKGSTTIERITADDGNQEMSWGIKKLIINEKFQSDIFTFIPPTGTEIIDMR